ncbi:Hypothetical Protein SiL_1973 [Sulfolobus islandicus LAL14/1]|uniref:Uncharacterized protein n=1 Tax=Saccharolobus islandicus LAL14/1 TaxID=1241935 RepID=M9UBC0_SACIS|nr:Hypothetical Protein SiL_1973 [Sulfolobus islandicus LAL14/1]
MSPSPTVMKPKEFAVYTIGIRSSKSTSISFSNIYRSVFPLNVFSKEYKSPTKSATLACGSIISTE